ncbi:MAG: DUF1801 domain-containing protein [Ignavibacteriales bacterium]|nr:DUF1801 domain-containing protein [Ignavibacteriales bacterium]
MTIKAKTPKEYIAQLPDDRKKAIESLRKVILKNLPKGFSETISYGMIGYVVPHTIYPGGYHCNPIQPLPFIAIASQKNHIALYHMALYADKKLLDWFRKGYPKDPKLDMGKSCVRFKKIENIPLELIGKLVKKVSVKDWIKLYESCLKN